MPAYRITNPNLITASLSPISEPLFILVARIRNDVAKHPRSVSCSISDKVQCCWTFEQLQSFFLLLKAREIIKFDEGLNSFEVEGHTRSYCIYWTCLSLVTPYVGSTTLLQRAANIVILWLSCAVKEAINLGDIHSLYYGFRSRMYRWNQNIIPFLAMES